VRRTPVVFKPGPKPPKGAGLGKTGKDLATQITEELTASLKFGTCDVIFVLDDLDCCDAETQRQLFSKAIEKVAGSEKIPQVIALAAPEVESWLIADWNNTIAKDVDLRGVEKAMKYFLSREKKVPFSAPESFGEYDAGKKACRAKLSSLIIEAAEKHENVRYSKGIHTPRLLEELDATVVAKKCPLFKTFMAEFAAVVRATTAARPSAV
jgi:hypothetical protein